MKRHEWGFDYTASTLAAAAEKKRDFRKSRLDWWEAKRANSAILRIDAAMGKEKS